MVFGFCEEDKKILKEFKPCEKIHLNPNQICIEPNGIFVNVFEQWFRTDALYVDGEGIYFTNAQTEDWSIYWKCPSCGHVNGPLDSRCQNKECPTRKKK
jgi:hypothetical protein